MFIAHLPAGYILSTSLFLKIVSKKIPAKSVLTYGLLGSILPDLDLAYFYLVDDRQHLHHSYWTHIPAFWIIIFIVMLVISTLARNRRLLIVSAILFSSTMLHLILDTLVGGIPWFYPLSDKYYSLVTIQSKYSWWVLNFILHWMFILEIAIFLYALVVYKKRNSKS